MATTPHDLASRLRLALTVCPERPTCASRAAACRERHRGRPLGILPGTPREAIDEFTNSRGAEDRPCNAEDEALAAVREPPLVFIAGRSSPRVFARQVMLLERAYPLAKAGARRLASLTETLR
jgi:hypothetical protein